MASIVIKLIDKDKPDLVEQARGELIGAEFTIEYEDEADFVGVDVKKNNNGDDGDEQIYGPMVILIGKKQD